MLQRWSKLERDFRMKNGRYDISKIPDIYDCVKYDVIHNATLGLEDTLELFRLSRALADIVIPQVREEEGGEGRKVETCENVKIMLKMKAICVLQPESLIRVETLELFSCTFFKNKVLLLLLDQLSV